MIGMEGTKNAIHTSKEREASTKENANISDSEKDNPTSIALPLLALALHNPKGLLLVPSQVQPASLKLTKYEDFLNRKRPGKKENESPLKLQKLVHGMCPT